MKAKQIFAAVLFAAALTPCALHSQKVYQDQGKVILDLTVEAGMPVGSVTDEPKYGGGFEAREIFYDPENSVAEGSINKKAFQMLEVAPKDVDANGALVDAATKVGWIDAFNGCKKLNHNGTGWRLPTQRELYLIYIFQPALESVMNNVLPNKGKGFAKANYWSASERGNYPEYLDYSMYLDFESGESVAQAKKSLYHARCVREMGTK